MNITLDEATIQQMINWSKKQETRKKQIKLILDPKANLICQGVKKRYIDSRIAIMEDLKAIKK